jgi:hypothetical protein
VGNEPERSENCRKALEWLKYLNARYPERRFVAPWLSVVMSGEPETDRDKWLEVDCAMVRAFDELWLAGCGAELTAGMQAELAAFPVERPVFLLRVLGDEPTSVGRTAAVSPIDPPHYAKLKPEPIDVIEGWNLGFHLAQVVKYVARAGRKGGADKFVEDLRKARWYLDRLIGDGRNGRA